MKYMWTKHIHTTPTPYTHPTGPHDAVPHTTPHHRIILPLVIDYVCYANEDPWSYLHRADPRIKYIKIGLFIFSIFIVIF